MAILESLSVEMGIYPTCVTRCS